MQITKEALEIIIMFLTGVLILYAARSNYVEKVQNKKMERLRKQIERTLKK